MRTDMLDDYLFTHAKCGAKNSTRVFKLAWGGGFTCSVFSFASVDTEREQQKEKSNWK